jgi:hypothetical protein
LAGVAAGAAVLGTSIAHRRDEPAQPTGTGVGGRAHLIFLTTKDGVSVLDQHGRLVAPPTEVAVATPGWSQVVTAEPDGAGTRVVVSDLATRRTLSANTFRDRLEPRVVSPTGDLVAAVTPGGAGIYGLHKPGGRESTRILVTARGGERARLELDGNLEPEVFSPDGDRLFVLDYLPAAEPDRFRVRAIDLAAGRLTPLSTRSGKAIPVGAEHELRAHRIATVFDGRRAMFFTLYSYEPDATAFVHCLHVGEGWIDRIDLPAPFGQERPGVHGIALSASGDRLCVVHAPSASVADIDPDQLVIKRVTRLARTGLSGKPNVQLTASGRLVVNVDNVLIATDPHREIPTPGEARGLALGAGADVWSGYPNGVVHFDLVTGEELGRLAVPGMFVVKHVRTTDR